MRRSALFFLTLLPLRAADARQGSPLISSFVRSEGVKIRREPHEVEELWGDVRYRRESYAVRSDWALYDHDTGVLKAKDNVVAEKKFDTGEVSTAYGSRGLHNMNTERGWLTGKDERERIRFTRSVPGRPEDDKGSAVRLDWDWKARILDLDGAVHTEGPEGQTWSRHARYDVDNRKLFLEGGRPVMTAHEEKWSAALQADRINALNVEPRVVHGEGDAQGWIFFRDRDAYMGKEKKKKS